MNEVRVQKIGDPAPWTVWAMLDRMRERVMKQMDDEIWKQIINPTFPNGVPDLVWDNGFTTAGITKESVLNGMRYVVNTSV